MSLAGALASLRAPPTTEEPDTICAVAIRDLYATGRQAKRYEAIRETIRASRWTRTRRLAASTDRAWGSHDDTPVSSLEKQS